MRRTLCSLVFVALCTAAQGHWTRMVFSGKSASTDVPVAHPLSYFTANPVLRDDGDELCAVCTPAAKARGTATVSSRLTPVATLAGFRIWDLIYQGSAGDSSTRTVHWKSILTQTGPDRYIEIYHLQASGPVHALSPSRVVKVGDESILATGDSDGGNGGGCWEGYWWFDPSGPHAVDFSTIRPYIAKRLPAGAHFSIMCSTIHLEDQRIESEVQAKGPECQACGSLGRVTAHFRLDGEHVKPLEITFVPSS